MAGTERKQIDWECVEREYRAGKLSIRKIARQCGCDEKHIRRKAKAEGWHRDLSEKINEAVRNKLVRSDVRSSEASEREVVDFAADRSVAALRDHHKILKRGISLIDQLMAEVKKLMADGMTVGKVATISKVLVSLSMATKNFIDKAS